MSNRYDIEPAIKLPALVYYWKRLFWLPHYTEKGVFVAPSGIMMRAEDLERHRAEIRSLALWPRSWQVKDSEP